MGDIPTNPLVAADAAMASLTSATKTSQSRVFCIDILLPQYDIRQGSKLYDEVLATEFCMRLARRIDGRTLILVRDDTTLTTVERVLKAREQERDNSIDDLLDDDDDEEEDLEEEEETSDDESDRALLLQGSNLMTSDVESFRQQLIMGWKDDDGVVNDDILLVEPLNDKEPVAPTPVFRLSSMLGSATIPASSDRTAAVVQAVKQNANPTDEEGTIIILSATCPEEMIAVRTLVAQFAPSKTILLVNCHLQPTPRELMSAPTIYSVLPLIARPKQGDVSAFQPKIVVLRRHPLDWQVFVDATGEGFELAGTFAPNRVEKKGPSMQLITSCVKKHLDSRRARQ